jgi:hypothetical protein
MSINPKEVVWDDKPDPAAVKWDGERRQERSSSGLVADALLDTPLPMLGMFSPRQLPDAIAGGLRGAGSIGATLMRPFESKQENEERRKSMTDALGLLGADTNSFAFGAGKLGGEIAGTAGAGGAAGNLLSRIPGVAAAMPGVINALRTGGMTTGQQTSGLLGGVRDLGTRALGGATSGALSAGAVDPNDALAGAAVGGALPVAAKAIGKTGKAIGSGVRKALPKASDEVAALANRAKELGIDIPADRLVNSKPLDAVASSLNYVPFSGRAGSESKMVTQLNQALSSTFGQDTSNVTQALRKAESKLGGEFDTFLRSNTLALDKQLLDDLADAANTAAKELSPDQASIIAKQVDEIIAKGAQGEIDGQAAYNIKKTLDRIGNRNSPEAWYALDLKKKLMEALNRSVGDEKARAFKTLREQYGNMLDLQKLAKNGVDGEISVARLANMKDINNKPLQEIADIAAQFVKPREGQHGAMQRAVVGLAGAPLAGASLGVPGLLGAGALMTAGRGANAALDSGLMRNAILGDAAEPIGLLSDPALMLGYQTAPVFLASGR